MKDEKQGLTYDDVLIKPKRSRVDSRSDVEISSELFDGVVLDSPVISANMDTVTEKEMANAMNNAGGVGILHRFMDIEEQAKQIEEVDGLVGGCVGVDGDILRHVELLLDSGADFITVDVAHGHLVKCVETVEEVREEYPDLNIMAGNVATFEGTKDLYEAGADVVKVGIGPGSLCTTRTKAGVGIPQFTAIKNAVEAREYLKTEKYHEYKDRKLRIVADGGVKRGGDMAKALGAGADAVMVGGLLASCPESASPTDEDGKTVARGSASEGAREDNDMDLDKPVEGGEVELDEGDPVKVVVGRLCNGVSSSFSYAGAVNIREFHDRVEFVKVSPTTPARNAVHLDDPN